MVSNIFINSNNNINDNDINNHVNNDDNNSNNGDNSKTDVDGYAFQHRLGACSDSLSKSWPSTQL